MSTSEPAPPLGAAPIPPSTYEPEGGVVTQPNSSKYQQMPFAVSAGRLDMAGRPRDQVVTLDVCNLCGAVVGNRPAHDVFCYSDDGPIAENWR